MREIKFRAWDGNRKRMVTPDVLAHNKNIGTWVTAYYDDKDGYLRNPGAMDNIILMQYTGLKDKNGTEIYEGDIIAWVDQWFPVEAPKAVVKMETLYDGDDRARTGWVVNDCFVDDRCEVIGNIYENGDLLDS